MASPSSSSRLLLPASLLFSCRACILILAWFFRRSISACAADLFRFTPVLFRVGFTLRKTHLQAFINTYKHVLQFMKSNQPHVGVPEISSHESSEPSTWDNNANQEKFNASIIFFPTTARKESWHSSKKCIFPVTLLIFWQFRVSKYLFLLAYWPI